MKKVNIKEEMTLREFTDKIRKINEHGEVNVWIEGNGDETVKLVFEEKEITLI